MSDVHASPLPSAGLPPHFVLDVHLGRLGRNLRITGLDALWRDDFGDDELLRISHDEQRVLLTRDRALFERAEPNRSHYVMAIDPGAQFREVISRFNLGAKIASGEGFLSRCLDCNSPILPVSAHQVADRLPGHVRLEFQEFFLCPRCERVFWKGSHFDRMREWLQAQIAALE
jgi:uncharacterized protein